MDRPGPLHSRVVAPQRAVIVLAMDARPPAGDRPVRLVLLPGMDGTEIMFAPLLAALPAWIQPEVVTYPEHGPNTYEDLLPQVVDAIARGGDCVVLGWSFSGPLALRAAVLDPARVRGVILAGSFVTPPLRGLRYLRLAVRTPVFAAVRVLRRLPLWLTRPPHDPLRRAKALIWDRVPARTLATRARAVLRVDAREDLQRCPCPLLYLAGTADHIVPPHNVAAIVRQRPPTQVAKIAGRHFALHTSAADGARAIAAFAGPLLHEQAGTRHGPTRQRRAGP
jgi:pimeloyl-ACP methyl ester carboxylesterase